MKPFVLISTRPDDESAWDEYRAFVDSTRLDEKDLNWIRLEQAPLPEINLDEISGVILTGSPFNASDPESEKSDVQKRVEAELSGLLDVLVANDFPYFGACYGVGTLGVHQGGVVNRDYPENTNSIRVTLTDEGLQDRLLLQSGLDKEFDAYVGHKESVAKLPANSTLLATGEACPVQMFKVKQNLYATQFHPELDTDSLALRMQSVKKDGYFKPEEIDELIEYFKLECPVEDAPRVLSAFAEVYQRSDKTVLTN